MGSKRPLARNSWLRLCFENSLKQLHRRWIRLHTHFASQHTHALVVGAQRARAVMIGRMQPDQQLMVRLAQRIECDQAFGEWERRREFFLLFKEGGESLQHLGNALPVLFAKWHEPVVVESRQEVILIELRRGGERLDLPGAIVFRSCGSGLGDRCLEINDVDRTGSVLPPSNREMSRLQQVAFGRQGSLQMMEKLPQIRACL